MKKLFLTAVILSLFGAASASAQGFLGLFGGNQNKKAIRVEFVEGDNDAAEEILLVRIRGVIQEREEEDSMPFKAVKDPLENVKKDLEAARKRKAIKAILVEINSPGG
ncbi:MAG: hypothetical protein PHD82_10735, partial [Candidatus Riflebacteria bacterium]|nr:hypothetical protein [Candidatus Riflebacteria bacterium]